MESAKKAIAAVTFGSLLTLACLWFFGPPPWDSNPALLARAGQAAAALDRQVAGAFAAVAQGSSPRAAAPTAPPGPTPTLVSATAAPRPSVSPTRAGPTPTLRPALPTATATPAPLPPPPGGVYVVQAGDSLSSIAARYGADVDALLEANSLTRGRFVWIGQQLVIPEAAAPLRTHGLASAPGSLAPVLSSVGGSDVSHVVQPGETLAGLAADYGLSVAAILAANALPPGGALQVGAEILLPRPTDAPLASVAAMKIKAPLPRVTARAPAAAAAQPTGLPGKLVFQTATGGDLYVIRADGSGLTRLTQGGLEPSLSPDGTWVAFTRWGENEGVYLIRADGTDEKRIFGIRQPRQAAWSPDGARIAFSFQKDSQDFEFRDKDGKVHHSTKYFWRTAVVSVDGTGFTELPTNSGQSFSPTWSPDSRRVAFAAGEGLVVTGWDGFYRELTHGAWHQSPAWSPNGRSIAFSIRRDNHSDLFLRAMDPDLAAEQTALTTNKGLDLVALTSQPMYADAPLNHVSPTWSPDGRHLAYLTDRDGRWRIEVMKPDGSDPRPLFGASLDGLGITYEFAGEKSLDWGR